MESDPSNKDHKKSICSGLDKVHEHNIDAANPDFERDDSKTDEYNSSDEEDGHVLNQYAEELVERCTKLLDELDHFRKIANREHASLQSGRDGGKGKNKLVTAVEMRHFRNAVQMELRGLEALTQQDPENEKVSCMMRSSNLIFLEAVWAVAKNCRGIESIVKTFYYLDSVVGDGIVQRKRVPVKVDIVAQAGVEWIKVCTIRQSRLMFEIGKATWGFEDEEEDEDDSGYASNVQTGVTFVPDSDQTASTSSYDQRSDYATEDEDEDDGESTDAIAIVKTAKALIKASRQTRIQYLHPSVTIVLSNVFYDPSTAEQPLKDFINRILATGARVQTSNGLLKLSPAPALEDVINKLIITPSLIAENITDPVNIDTTILLALISDISHQDVPLEPRFHETVLRQLQMEKDDPFLPSSIYPLCQGREMVCTDEAYKRFMSITDIVGSKTEKLRATLILQTKVDKQQQEDNSTSDQLHTQFQELSKHTLPQDMHLPIHVVPSMDSQWMTENKLAAAVGVQLSANNRSVLFTGWREKMTTLTSNGSVAKRLETLLEQHSTESGQISGPQVLVLPTSRSLIGTAKKGGEIVGSYRG